MTSGAFAADSLESVLERSDSMSVASPKEIIGTVTGDTFTGLVLQGKGPIVVEFMSYGCTHCRTIAPILEHVAKLLEDKEQIFMVNVAVDRELVERFEIEGTPTFMMFLNGRILGTVEGLRPELSAVLAAVTQPYE